MTNRSMRKGLAHNWAADPAVFLAAVDATGGWPLGFKYAGFEHTSERDAGFCNSPHNDGWWTVVATADDYYLWKLSPEALQRIVDATVPAIRLPVPKASALLIRDGKGHRASVSAAPYP